MKIETTFQDDHQAKITAEIAPEQFEEFKQRAGRKLAKKVKIPGFRPGKAPYPVIARQLGEGAIVEEALEILVDDMYPKIIEESGIKPYGPGTLENIQSMDPPVLEFVVPLDAEVDLGDYHSLKKDYQLPELDEKEVDSVLNNLRQRQVVLEDVDRPAQDSDLVTVKLSAKRAGAEEESDGVLIKERSFPILVQSKPSSDDEESENKNNPYEWPFFGFSKHLEGLSVGEEKSFEYTYPEDAEQEGFRGVTAVFDIQVEGVKSRLLPELNDDFAKSLGEYDTMEELLKEVRDMLEEQNRDVYNDEYTESLLDEAIELGVYKYPPQMVERELDNLIQNLENRLQQQKMTIDLYLKSREMDMEALREETRPLADKQLRKQLFLMEMAKAENLEVDQNLLIQETDNTMKYLTSGMPENEVKKFTNQENFQNVFSNVYVNLLNRAALERLRDIANGQLAEKEIAAQEAAQAAEETEPEVQDVEAQVETVETSTQTTEDQNSEKPEA